MQLRGVKAALIVACIVVIAIVGAISLGGGGFQLEDSHSLQNTTEQGQASHSAQADHHEEGLHSDISTSHNAALNLSLASESPPAQPSLAVSNHSQSSQAVAAISSAAPSTVMAPPQSPFKSLLPTAVVVSPSCSPASSPTSSSSISVPVVNTTLGLKLSQPHASALPVPVQTKKTTPWWTLPIPKAHFTHKIHPLALQQPTVCNATDPLPFDAYSASLVNNSHGVWSYNTPNLREPAFARWYNVSDGHCSLRRVTHAEVLQCLRNKHIFFVGDSLLRYQYLSLVTFLHTGRYPRQMGGNLTHPSPVWEGEHGNFRNFFVNTNAQFGGAERCDCYRDVGGTNTSENRYYYNAANNINVSMIYYWRLAQGRSPVHWTNSGVLNNDTYGNLKPRDWYGGLRSIAYLIRQQIAGGAVDELVLNTGWWKVPGFSDGMETAKQYLQGFKHVVRNKLGPIWATTTASKSLQDRAPPRDGMLGSTYLAALDMRWRILDRYGITEALKDHFAAVELPREFGWVDALHFRPFVYEEFNNLLLNMMCKT